MFTLRIACLFIIFATAYGVGDSVNFDSEGNPRQRISPSHSTVQEYASKALEKLSKEQGNFEDQILGIVSINEASVTYMNGRKFEIEMTVGLYENKEGGELIQGSTKRCTVSAFKGYAPEESSLDVSCDD